MKTTNFNFDHYDNHRFNGEEIFRKYRNEIYRKSNGKKFITTEECIGAIKWALKQAGMLEEQFFSKRNWKDQLAILGKVKDKIGHLRLSYKINKANKAIAAMEAYICDIRKLIN